MLIKHRKSSHILISSRALKSSSILNSTLIQVVHVHPDNAHRIRSDLDQEDLVIDHFPVDIAKSLLGNALFEPPQPTVILKRKRSHSRSSLKCADSVPAPDTIPIVPPAKLLKASTSLRGGEIYSETTPQKQQLPQVKLDPDDTILTARATTPDGDDFAPLKREPSFQSPRSPLTLLKNTNSIPTALFSPPRVSRSRGRGRGRGRGGATSTIHKLRNPPPLVHFDRTPRSIDGSNPKMTLVLRHDLPLQGLKDFFVWCKRSVQDLRIVPLEGFLLNFHDWNRVEQIKEVALTIGMTGMNKVCDALMDRWRAQLERDRSRKLTIQALLS